MKHRSLHLVLVGLVGSSSFIPAQSLDPAPEDLADICSAESVAGPGYWDCARSCIAASCCQSMACGDDAMNCLGYAPCLSLSSVDPPIPEGPLEPAPADIGELCSADNVGEGVNVEFLDCAEICAPATCCSEDCMMDPNCLSYAPCLVLADNMVDGPGMAPEDLAEMCSADSVATMEGYADCAGHCTPAMCCDPENTEALGFTGTGCETAPSCDGYSPCTILYTTDPPVVPAPTAGGSELAPTPTPAGGEPAPAPSGGAVVTMSASMLAVAAMVAFA